MTWTDVRRLLDELDDVDTSGGSEGDVLTEQADGTFALEAPAGGVSDHGALTGLGDDDHPQYLRGTDGGKGTINVVASSGATETLDLGDGNDHDVTLDDDCTLTLAGATAGFACWATVLLRQDATGGHEVTWPAAVEWAGGSAPTLQADGWDVVQLFTYDGGTTWFGFHTDTSSGSSGSSDGRYEVVVSGTGPPVAVTNEDEDDWVYGKVSD